MVYVNENLSRAPQPLRATIGRSQSDDNQAVNTLRQLIGDAVRRGISDIHIEPQQDTLNIRQRLDGELALTASLPLALAPRLISRIKVMAELDIAERRLPQDGRINLAEVSGLTDLRVSTVPTLWGEKAVLRILNHPRAQLTTASLGMTKLQRQRFMSALFQPQGLILVTGPTGSGKTLTLYSGLEELNNEQRNISTVEDPIEIHLDGINQIAVNEKIGLSFSRVLRALLRQDPDVIMVGEIRDLETATAAIRAAQTGHLVLSTLHSGSAGTALSRLHQMGINFFDLTSTVSLIMAQRLARRLCDHCKQTTVTPTRAGVPGTAPFQANPDGCVHCSQGYRGRVGIFEQLPIDAGAVRTLHETHSRCGFADPSRLITHKNLRDAALEQVATGMISLEEADRITLS